MMAASWAARSVDMMAASKVESLEFRLALSLVAYWVGMMALQREDLMAEKMAARSAESREMNSADCLEHQTDLSMVAHLA